MWGASFPGAQAWECRLLAITLSGRVEVEVLKGWRSQARHGRFLRGMGGGRGISGRLFRFLGGFQRV